MVFKAGSIGWYFTRKSTLLRKIAVIIGLLVIIYLIMLIIFPNMFGNIGYFEIPQGLPDKGFMSKGFNSNTICRNLDNTYLSSADGLNISTGTSTRVFTGNHLTIHVIAELPDTQSTFEYTRKDKCECHCNGLIDCYCGNGTGNCPYYMAWLINDSGHKLPLGKLSKFRDGFWRVEKIFTKDDAPDIANHNKVVVTFESNHNNKSFEVIKGFFSNKSSFCK